MSSRSKSLSLIELFELFPDEESAIRELEANRWPEGVECPHCESARITEVKDHRPMKWRCKDCRKFFSVRIGTAMQDSRLPARKWVLAIYILASSPKGVSSIRLGEMLDIPQQTAWSLGHRIRNLFAPDEDQAPFEGTVEVDEMFVGGLGKNMHVGLRWKASGNANKAIVIGAKCRETGEVRAQVIEGRAAENLEPFVWNNVVRGGTVYTDAWQGYNGLKAMGYKHSRVDHDANEYVSAVDPEIHTQGIEGFWAMPKRAYKGTHHWWSFRHMQRYVDEFTFRVTHRELSTLDLMRLTFRRMEGRRLTCGELVPSSC